MLSHSQPFSFAGRLLPFLLIFAFAAQDAAAQSIREQVLTEALLVRLPKTEYEVVGSIDPVQQMLVSDNWSTPDAGDELPGKRDSVVRWERATADSAGWFHHEALKGGYVLFLVKMPKDTTLLLRGMGNSMAWVNGVPRAGNPYADKDVYESWEPDWRYSLLPVEFHKGENRILFYCARDVCKAVLAAPSKPVFFNLKDVTVPDLVAGEKSKILAAVLLVNASNRDLSGWKIVPIMPDGTEKGEMPRLGQVMQGGHPIAIIQSCSLRKVAVGYGIVRAYMGDLPMRLALLDESGTVRDTATLQLRVVSPSQPRRETFISSIDGSVQYYAVNPQIPVAAELMNYGAERPALIFSLHGASVEAIGQASAYSSKSWAVLVAPTNRRPYGYNWEDWGRLDALEVFDIAQKFNYDPERVYLTGHSMGGHGTWHLGTLYPDKWAAIGPSAGWVSFWSYRVRGKVRMATPAAAMTFRGTNASDTKALAVNLKPLGVYILHGEVDDNVLAKESRGMAERLGEFHRDFIYHEQKGENHWWDLSDEAGADCVDWAPMQDFFNHHRRPRTEEVRSVEFTTPHPGVSSSCEWVTVLAQEQQAMPSSVSLRFDPGTARIVGRTANVFRLKLNLAALHLKDSVTLRIDDNASVTVAAVPELWLQKENGRWMTRIEPAATDKNPKRCGPFKDVFRNNVVLVFGTRGSAEENRWAFEQARYDAERFWYQGNGSMQVLSDMDFVKRTLAEEESSGRHNVVLYGNANTNTAWKMLLADSPVQVRNGSLSVGARTIQKKGLFCLFLRPRANSSIACVAAVSGTDIEGMRAAMPLGYLSPGLPFPDLLISQADLYTRGEDALVASGYFGIDWSVEKGEIAWNLADDQ